MAKIHNLIPNRREFIREKRRALKDAKKALEKLRNGSAVDRIFDGTRDFYRAVCQMERAMEEMDRITKQLR